MACLPSFQTPIYKGILIDGGAQSIQVPQWVPQDLVWQSGRRCFEMRVDNAPLASWMSGLACCATEAFHSRISAILDVLRDLVQFEGWCLRQPWSDWVVWYPRERNVLADLLANRCLDLGQSLAVRSSMPLPVNANYVTVSDGASRASTKSSSAAWALLAFSPDHINLSAVMFDTCAFKYGG